MSNNLVTKWTLILGLLTAWASTASAHRRPAPRGFGEISLVCDGSPCQELGARGQRWVVGEYGQRYTIALINRSDVWLEAVVTVDGRSILDGDRMSSRSRGYLLAPRARVEVEGWRVSSDNVAAFRFTSVGDSYAGRIGDASDAGQIRVDFYPERTREVWVPTPPHRPEPWGGAFPEEDGDGAKRAPRAADEARAAAPRWESEDHQNLGTRFGERRWQPVSQRDFERADRFHPAQSIVLRYDDARGLRQRGILPRPRWDDDGWVPPPPRWEGDVRWVPAPD